METGIIQSDQEESKNINVIYSQRLSSIEKIKDVFGKQAEMPELGYDSLFIHCQSETEAERNLSYIKSAGLNASVIQNKRDWQIRIDFSDAAAR